MLGTADADVERYLKLFTFIPIENISMVMEAQRASPSKRLAQHLLAREMVELAHGAFRAKAAEQEHKHAFAIGTNLFSLGVLRNILARAVTDTRRGPHQAEEEEDPKKKAKIESLVKYKLQFAAAAGGASSQASNATTTPAPAAKDNMVTLPYTFVARSTLPQLLHATGLVSSKSEAQRLIRNNGAYVVVPGSGEPETPLNLKWDKIAEKSNPTDFLLDFQALVVRSGKKDIRICRVVKDKEFEEMGLDFPGWEEFRAMHAEAETGAEAVKTEMPEQTTGEEAAAKQ